MHNLISKFKENKKTNPRCLDQPNLIVDEKFHEPTVINGPISIYGVTPCGRNFD